ncbi:sensor histidine kinase [Arthrobacter sp. HLT1-20]
MLIRTRIKARLPVFAGPHVLSLWSWLLSLPIALTVMNGFAQSPSWEGGARGAAVIALVHLALGVLGMVLRWAVRLPARPGGRAAGALVAFAVLGASRPFLILWASPPLGVPQLNEGLLVRVLINVVTSVVVLSAIALLVDSVRQHRAIASRLRTAQATIEMQRGFDEERLVAIRRNYANQLEKSINAALAAHPVETLDRHEASRLLRSISDDVVRPMSHTIFHDETPWSAGPAPAAPAIEDTRLRELLGLLRPAPPVLPVLLFGTLAMVYLYTIYGPVFTLLQLGGGAALLMAGNMAAIALARRARGPLPRILAMVGCYTAGAAASTTLTCLLQQSFGYPLYFYWSSVFFYPLTACVVALLRAAGRRRALGEARLAHSLSEQLRLSDRVQQKLLHLRRQIAHFLHSNVQGELVSAALLLGGDDRDGRTLTESVQLAAVVTGTLARLQQEMLAEPERDAGAAAARIGALLDTWGHVVVLSQDIDPSIWTLCEAAPERADALIDVLSEGFTNAIRHGRARDIALRIWAGPVVWGEDGWAPESIHVTVSSPGRLRRPLKYGLGVAGLQRLATTVSLEEHDARVVLAVVLP